MTGVQSDGWCGFVGGVAECLVLHREGRETGVVGKGQSREIIQRDEWSPCLLRYVISLVWRKGIPWPPCICKYINGEAGSEQQHLGWWARKELGVWAVWRLGKLNFQTGASVWILMERKVEVWAATIRKQTQRTTQKNHWALIDIDTWNHKHLQCAYVSWKWMIKGNVAMHKNFRVFHREFSLFLDPRFRFRLKKFLNDSSLKGSNSNFGFGVPMGSGFGK